MANPAKNARDKAQAIWPGASVVGRVPTGIRHQHPTDPNKFMLDAHIGPIHFNGDQEIDTAWVPATAPWDYEMVLAEYNARVLADFSSGQIVKYTDPVSEESISFQPQQLQWTNDLDQIQPIENPQAVIAVIDDDELYWTGAFGANIDLKWQAQTARLDKRLIIQNFAALPALQQFIIDGGNPVLRLQFIFQKSAELEIFVNDVLWNERANNPVETSGYVSFRKDGQEVWAFNLPRSFSDVDQLVGTFRLSKTGPNLFVEHRIPYSWLQGATYPLEIDVTIDPRVGASGDDWYHDNTPLFNTGAVGWNIGDPFSQQPAGVGYRVTISGPVSGDTCDVAHVGWEARAGRADDVTFDMYGWDENDPAAPTSRAEATGYTATTASVNQVWTTNTSANVEYTFAEIKTIIQELWDSGFGLDTEHISIAIEVTASGAGLYQQAKSYDEDTTKAPTLHIEYTVGAVGGRIMSSLADSGGLADRGGIAGPGGGLAG